MKHHWLYGSLLAMAFIVPAAAQVFVTNNSSQDAFIAQLAQKNGTVFSVSVNRIKPGEQRVLDLFSWQDGRTVTKGYVLVSSPRVIGVKSTGFFFLEGASTGTMYPFNAQQNEAAQQFWDSWWKSVRNDATDCPSDYCRFIPLGNPSQAYQYEISEFNQGSKVAQQFVVEQEFM